MTPCLSRPVPIWDGVLEGLCKFAYKLSPLNPPPKVLDTDNEAGSVVDVVTSFLASLAALTLDAPACLPLAPASFCPGWGRSRDLWRHCSLSLKSISFLIKPPPGRLLALIYGPGLPQAGAGTRAVNVPGEMRLAAHAVPSAPQHRLTAHTLFPSADPESFCQDMDRKTHRPTPVPNPSLAG